MPPKEAEYGPTAHAVRANIKRLRTAQNLTVAELSRRLQELGRPIAVLGISRIEKGERRVDVDDLLALSVALSTSPIGLLMPAGDPETTVEATGVGEARAGDLFRYLVGEDDTAAPASDADVSLDWLMRARPRWARTTYTEGDLKKMMAELLEDRDRGDD